MLTKAIISQMTEWTTLWANIKTIFLKSDETGHLELLSDVFLLWCNTNAPLIMIHLCTESLFCTESCNGGVLKYSELILNYKHPKHNRDNTETWSIDPQLSGGKGENYNGSCFSHLRMGSEESAVFINSPRTAQAICKNRTSRQVSPILICNL